MNTLIVNYLLRSKKQKLTKVCPEQYVATLKTGDQPISLAKNINRDSIPIFPGR